MVRPLQDALQRHQATVPYQKRQPKHERHGPLQLLHRPGSQRIQNPSGGILMYTIKMRRYWNDGTFTEIDTSNPVKTYKNFNEAADIVNQMNRHTWLFHQDQAPVKFHYVKEI